MDWAKHFYTTRSEWFGPTGIFPEHRARAAEIERLCGSGRKRILELGAGAGGTAAVMADLGHEVVAIELSPLRAAFARELAAQARTSLTVLEADFYAVDVSGPFDVVCYWDGFGVGSDADQRRLLRRVKQEWLRSQGIMLLDVFSPSFWAARAGKGERVEKIWRLVKGNVRTVRLDVPVMAKYDFDPISCRFLSKWWPRGRKRETISESLRCYSPADLLLLLEGTGLVADRFEVCGEPFFPDRETGTVNGLLRTHRSYRVRLM